MSDKTETHAASTVHSALLDAISTTAHITGMRPGPAVDALLEALAAAVRDPMMTWAFIDLAAGDEETRAAARALTEGTPGRRQMLITMLHTAGAVIDDVSALARRYDDDGLQMTITRKASSARSEDLGHAVAFAAVLLDRREQRARGVVLECGAFRHWVKGSNSDDADDVYDGHCTSPDASRALQVRVLASYRRKPSDCPGAEARA